VQRDGDVLFEADMEVSFDVTEAMRGSATYEEYPAKVLNSLLARAPQAPLKAVDGVGRYPLDLFPIRSLSGRRRR